MGFRGRVRSRIQPVLVLSVCCFLAPLALAAEPADPATLLKGLTDRGAGKLVVMREKAAADSPIISLAGNLADAAPGGAMATAKAFIESHGTLLGFPPGALPTEYGTFSTGKKEAGGETLTLVPARGGVRYLGGGVIFSFQADGKLRMAAGRYRNLASVPPAGIDSATASKRALSEVAKKFPGSWMSGNGTLTEVIADTEDGGLAHRFVFKITVGDARDVRRVVLGPGGELLQEEDGDQAGLETATGRVFSNYPANDVVPGTLPDLYGVSEWGVGLFGKQFTSDSSYPGLIAVLEDSKVDYEPYLVPPVTNIPNFHLPGFNDPRFLEVNAYHHLTTARAKAIEFGAVEVDGEHIVFDIWSNKRNNAYYSPSDHKVRYARSNPGLGEVHPARDASVTYHEYGHHVQWSLCNTYDSAGNTVDNNEASGLGEGFADVFANSITGKSNVFEVWAATAPGVQRDASKAVPPDFEYCKLTPCIYNSGGTAISCHDTGRVFSGLCWELKDKVFNGDASWLMRRIVWALRDSPGPHTFRRICLAMLSDQILMNDDPRFMSMYDIMVKRGVIRFSCD